MKSKSLFLILMISLFFLTAFKSGKNATIELSPDQLSSPLSFNYLTDLSALSQFHFIDSSPTMNCPFGSTATVDTGHGFSYLEAKARAEFLVAQRLSGMECNIGCEPSPCALNVSTSWQLIDTGPWFPNVYVYTIEYCRDCCEAC